MTEHIGDGGPAFPLEITNDGMIEQPGMSLRDWLAGQALAGICSAAPPVDPHVVAIACCRIADAVLAELEKTPRLGAERETEPV